MATLPKPADPLQSPTTSTQSTDGRTQQAHVTNTIRGLLRRHGVWPEKVDVLAAEIETVIWGNVLVAPPPEAPAVVSAPAPAPAEPIRPPPPPPPPPPPLTLPGVDDEAGEPDEDEPVPPPTRRRMRKRSS